MKEAIKEILGRQTWWREKQSSNFCYSGFLSAVEQERWASKIAALIAPPPDSSLLTDEEIEKAIAEMFRQHSGKGYYPSSQLIYGSVAQAQDAKTASLVRAECEARVKAERERVLKELEDKFKMWHYAQDPYGGRKEDTYTIMIPGKAWDSLKKEEK